MWDTSAQLSHRKTTAKRTLNKNTFVDYSPCEIPRSSPASPRNTIPIPSFLIRICHYYKNRYFQCWKCRVLRKYLLCHQNLVGGKKQGLLGSIQNLGWCIQYLGNSLRDLDFVLALVVRVEEEESRSFLMLCFLMSSSLSLNPCPSPHTRIR